MSESAKAPDLSRLRMLAELRRFGEAEDGLRRYLATRPDDPEAMLLLADVLDEREQHAEAEQLARRAVAAAPQSPAAHQSLCRALLQTGRHGEAVASAEAAVRLAPHDWTTHYTLGLALRSGRRPRYRDALGCANEAVRLAPHVSHTHNLAGMCLDDLRMYDEAQRAYAEALRLDPTSATALNNLAALHINRGRLSRASSFLTAGLSSDAQERMLHLNYDAILHKLMYRLYLTALLVAGLVAVVTAVGAPWALKAALGVLLVPAYVLVGRGVTRALPRGVQHWARGLFGRSNAWQRVAICIFVATTAAVLVMAFGTAEVTRTVGLGVLMAMRVVGLAVIVGGVLVLGSRMFRRG